MDLRSNFKIYPNLSEGISDQNIITKSLTMSACCAFKKFKNSLQNN